MNALVTRTREIRHAHLFCGLGGGARGINRSFAQVGNEVASYRCIGGIDSDPRAIENFNRLAKCQGTVLDLFSRDQYLRFHGHEPPKGWKEATPQDIHKAFNYEKPHFVFTSPPCKGFSGLLAESTSKTDKYQALNELAVRGIWLTLEAFADDPVEFIALENVPRIKTRGRWLLDQIIGVLDQYNYSVAESVHDCGELGGLSQSRKRLLLLARHRSKVAPFLYEPPKRKLRGVGEVLSRLPMPGDPAGGPLHRIPALQFQTWARLAFVTPGKDWRSLNRLRVVDGVLADYGIVPERALRNGAFGVRRWDETSGTVAGETLPTNGNFAVADPRVEKARDHHLGLLSFDATAGVITGNAEATTGRFSVADPRLEQAQNCRLGVQRWDEATGTVTGNSRPDTGAFSVADPRIDGHSRSVQLGVREWTKPAPTIKGDVSVGGGPYAVADPRDERWASGQAGVTAWTETAATITSQRSPLQGRFSVSDPRAGENGPRFSNVYRVVAFDQHASAVTGQGGNSAACVADPRGGETRHTGGRYRVTPFDEPCNTVIGASTTGQGAFAIADPRTGYGPTSHQNKLAMVGWDQVARTVTGASQVQGGALSVADPRPAGLKLGRDYESSRHYGVLNFSDHSLAVPGFAKHDNGAWSVADPRTAEGDFTEVLPAPTDRLVAVIRTLDGFWNRPFTSLELAALQSLVDPDDPSTYTEIQASSESYAREMVGNAVPPSAAQAIGNVIGQTLLLAWTGETFMLNDTPIWCRSMAIGLALDQPGLDSFYLNH